MADSLNVCTNVLTTLIHLTESMVTYLRNVNNAPKERVALLSELGGLLNLLQLLENRVKVPVPLIHGFPLFVRLGSKTALWMGCGTAWRSL
jgi:hypothetical protein